MAGPDRLRAGYHNLRRREIIELVPTSAKTILDVGCGTGELGKALKERQPCHVTGIELNKEAFKLAEKNLDVCFCDNVNRHDPALAKVTYDCIIFADILEHLISPWWALLRHKKVLREGGTIIASVPNVGHPFVLEQLQRGIFRYELAGLLDITHLRFFTKTTLFQLFYKAGLKVVECKSYPSDENPLQYLVTAVKPKLPFAKPLVTILILSYNGWRFTKKCIESIKERTHTPYKILVVDNASTDKTIEQLRNDESIFHIENTCNHGFARGMNIGLELIDTPYFVISNTDVVMTQGWLGRLVEHIETDKSLMLLGPRSNYVSGPQEVEKVSYKNDEEMQAYASKLPSNIENPVTYFFRIVFFCALLKSEVLNKIGYLDEKFVKSNYEDDDFCVRLAKNKLKAGYDNTVFIHHWGRASFRENKMDWEGELATNRAIFMKKWGLKEYGPGKPLPCTDCY